MAFSTIEHEGEHINEPSTTVFLSGGDNIGLNGHLTHHEMLRILRRDVLIVDCDELEIVVQTKHITHMHHTN